MAKIIDCVVIEQTFLEEIRDKLYLLGCDRLADMCHNYKQLEPIVKDAWIKAKEVSETCSVWNCEGDICKNTLSDYLNEKNI